MSTRTWTCRNPRCPCPQGAVLGHLTSGGMLRLLPSVTRVTVHLDSRHVMVTCPCCGSARRFEGGSIFIDHAHLLE